MSKDTRIQRIETSQQSLDFPGEHSTSARFDVLDIEAKIDLLTYWQVILRRRWMVAVVALITFTLVLVWTLRQTPKYRAKALLEIQKESSQIATVQELFELESVSDAYLETQYKILESESLARRVIEQLELHRLPEFGGGQTETSPLDETVGGAGALQDLTASPAPGFSEGEHFSRALRVFFGRLTINPIKRSRLVEVSFLSEDSKLAAEIVNVFSDNYIEQNLEARYRATQMATEWLSTELIDLKGRLERAEEELQRYMRVNGLLFLESEEGDVQNLANERLRQLQEELTRAQATRYEREALYRLVEAGRFDSLPGVFEDRLIQDLAARLAELKQEEANLLSTFTPEYPGVKRLQDQIAEIQTALDTERGRGAEKIRNEYRAAVERENLLQQAFDQQRGLADRIGEKTIQYNILKREVDTNREIYEGVLQRLREAGVSAGLRSSNIRVVDPAVPPEKPAVPRVRLMLVLGFLCALTFGVGAAFLQEYLDDTLKSTEDVERVLRLPSLGIIPQVHAANGKKKLLATAQGKVGRLMHAAAAPPTYDQYYRVDAEGSYHTDFSEAFRGLRTSVLLSSAGHPPRTLLITSSQPGEGKTTVSLNLSISFAQLGRKVLMIDGDLRRPSIGKLFGIEGAPGLVGVLTGQQGWKQAVCRVDVPGLDVLPTGPVPPNPAELLSSETMATLLEEAALAYDVVIIDSPPVLNVADSRILSKLVDGLIFVVKGGFTHKYMAKRAETIARSGGANIIGVVLNTVDPSGGYYSGYYYGYGSDSYGPAEGGAE